MSFIFETFFFSFEDGAHLNKGIQSAQFIDSKSGTPAGLLGNTNIHILTGPRKLLDSFTSNLAPYQNR